MLRLILAVPVERYKLRPAHWKQHGPPPWVHEPGWEREHGRDHERDHD